MSSSSSSRSSDIEEEVRREIARKGREGETDLREPSRRVKNASSRPSKNNRQEGLEGYERPESSNEETGREGLEPGDLPGRTGLRPLSVEEGTRLRDEAVMTQGSEPHARNVAGVVNAFRRWHSDYESMHIEFESPEGETVRTRLENSYQESYAKRYYARLKDLERGIERQYDELTTVMLTFSASSLNANGQPRAPADHMREIAEGWNTARKQVHQVLDGERWEYARVWEPHEGGERSPGGYGHLHVALFVETESLEAERFAPVMDSYVRDVGPAGPEAHDLDGAVSVNDSLEALSSYVSEYLGLFEGGVFDRPVYQQMFFAVTWATNTRRLDFSNGAQEIISGEEFRRETGLRPQDRGEAGGDSEASESGTESGELDMGAKEELEEANVSGEGEGETWKAESICVVSGEEPDYMDPTKGGVEMTAIAGRSGDPPRELDPGG